MSEYDKEPLSRAEEILDETSSGTEYDKEPLSRVELRLKEVMAKIDGLVPDATVYKPAGSVTFANLPTPSKSTLGYVYDVSDAFTTTSDFKEGSGKKYPAGTNVAIVDIGTDENPIYKYDVLSGFIDMDNYVEKEAGKGLSSNDFTDAAKNKLDGLVNYDDTEIKNDISDLSDAVSDKVDKVAGKGLSTNDFTDAAKNKLAGLVNYDDTEIKNDISELETGKVDKVNGKGLSTNDYTDADKALVQDSPITVSATASPISTANGKLRKLTIYGKSEIVDGAIKSAGEGWNVVDLGALNWNYNNNLKSFYTTSLASLIKPNISDIAVATNILTRLYKSDTINNTIYGRNNMRIASNSSGQIYISNFSYTEPATFKSAMSGVLLCYQLADPTQGNTIAIKTDDGTGIDGTMAIISTGMPLMGTSVDARDTLAWNGTSGAVEKVCTKIRLADLTWNYSSGTSVSTVFATTSIVDAQIVNSRNDIPMFLCSAKTSQSYNGTWTTETITQDTTGAILCTADPAITTVSDFVASLGDAELVYELATPTTEQLTTAENDSLSALKTYSPQTSITINDNPDFKIETYANTANSKAMQELQGQIDEITVELTQAEYDALTEEEKNNGTIYFITDAPSGITIDSELSTTSTNAVQNRVITSQVNKILSEAEIQAQINDHIYQGTDSTVKFASEISASPYNGDPWAWIKSRITAGDFTGIHIADYIPITTTNNITLNAQIAGINTYKNYGDSAVGSHIDFICKELWTTLHSVNPVNFNNGTAEKNNPWLASDLYLYLNSLSGDVPNGTTVNPETVAVDYTADGVYYFLPTQLKNVIIEKKFLLPTRYSASGLLSDDNSWAWKNIGKLWLPDECEVYSTPVWGGKGGYSLGGSALQYPLFAGNMNRLKFRNGSRYDWWLLSPYSGRSAYWCLVDSRGCCGSSSASNSGIAAPVCFRVG